MKKQIVAMSSVALALGVAFANAGTLTTQSKKTSYAMGYETGKAMLGHHIKLDQQAYALGLKEGLGGKSLSMSESQIKATLIAFQKKSMAQFKAKMNKESLKNLLSGKEFLAKNKTVKGVKVTHSGLQYLVMSKGTGPVPTLKDTVTVDYAGMLINGNVFDSSYKRGQKATFPVSAVIKGWQEALTMMHVGSTWKIFVPAKLAYGKMGAPGAIGPNETLIFKVHLYSIKK